MDQKKRKKNKTLGKLNLLKLPCFFWLSKSRSCDVRFTFNSIPNVRFKVVQAILLRLIRHNQVGHEVKSTLLNKYSILLHNIKSTFKIKTLKRTKSNFEILTTMLYLILNILIF